MAKTDCILYWFLQSQISFLENKFLEVKFVFEGKLCESTHQNVSPSQTHSQAIFVVQTSEIWLSPQVIWAPTVFWKVDAEGAACPLIVTVIKVALIVKRAYIWQDVLFPVEWEYK